ncbi:hypothetical protein F2Q70_00008249 [Brassica cretica]|uniref:Uncharacterized protein n=1 Tax=Brassica cretica TaxID=69181 RepID=A0A8S9M351_BRACR|nr:hypothetical protein F2Q70_00008249 [Brassica cretica]
MKISIGLKNFKIWNYNKSGEYSSNSGYWFASQHLKSESRLEAERLPSITSLKELVWKLKIPPTPPQSEFLIENFV